MLKMNMAIFRMLFCVASHLSRLAAAVSYDHLELAEYLIKRGASVSLTDREGNTALHFCETSRMAKLLVDNGADLRASNENDETPADVAMEEGFEDVLTFLVSCASHGQ